MEIMAGEYRLRQFTADDINSFYELAHDELVKKYVPFVYPRNLEDAKEMVKNYLDGDCKNDFYFSSFRVKTIFYDKFPFWKIIRRLSRFLYAFYSIILTF